MRRSTRGALLLASLLMTSCGESAGFRIDDVSVSPEDIPVNTPSAAFLSVNASVIGERHEVLDVWVDSDEGAIWIDLEKKVDPRWSGKVPLAAFQGFVVGDYFLDVHARDYAGREITLENAVRFRIEPN